MTASEILAELKPLAKDSYKKVLLKHGISEPVLGVSVEEMKKIQKRIKKDYQRQTDIRYGAARGWVDAIIAPSATRDVLVHSLSCATRPGPRGGFRAGVLQV